MPQLDVYKSRSKKVELLLDLQDDMLQNHSTRVVAPLVPPNMFTPRMNIVNPALTLNGKEYILLTHLLAAVKSNTLGKNIGSVSEQRNQVVAALGMLFTGI